VGGGGGGGFVGPEIPGQGEMKYVLVTGGVVSGLGKGVTASSIGVILKACGLRITSIKIGTCPPPPSSPPCLNEQRAPSVSKETFSDQERRVRVVLGDSTGSGVALKSEPSIRSGNTGRQKIWFWSNTRGGDCGWELVCAEDPGSWSS